MNKRLFSVLVALVLAMGIVMPVDAGDKKDKDFTLWFDAGQPSVIDWGSGHQGHGGDTWLILGFHFSGCRLGRLRSCGLGFAWGAARNGAAVYENVVWQHSLLVTAPQTIRLTDADDDVPELDFAVTPFYDTKMRRWGFMVGFSIGG